MDLFFSPGPVRFGSVRFGPVRISSVRSDLGWIGIDRSSNLDIPLPDRSGLVLFGPVWCRTAHPTRMFQLQVQNWSLLFFRSGSVWSGRVRSGSDCSGSVRYESYSSGSSKSPSSCVRSFFPSVILFILVPGFTWTPLASTPTLSFPFGNGLAGAPLSSPWRSQPVMSAAGTHSPTSRSTRP